MRIDFESLLEDIAVEANDNLLVIGDDNGDITRAQLMRMIEREGDKLLLHMRKLNSDIVYDSVDISYVADQAEYNLPGLAASIKEVRPLDADGNEETWVIEEMRWEDRNHTGGIPFTQDRDWETKSPHCHLHPVA